MIVVYVFFRGGGGGDGIWPLEIFGQKITIF